jgi:hypothetical protein
MIGRALRDSSICSKQSIMARTLCGLSRRAKDRWVTWDSWRVAQPEVKYDQFDVKMNQIATLRFSQSRNKNQ